MSKGEANTRAEIISEVKIAIERNFGGKLKASEIMGKYFSQKEGAEDIYEYLKTPDVRELIHMNMEDRDSRFLMLIGRPDVLTFILERYFKDQILENRILVGSNLENDLNQEEYGFRSLSDIILYVEKGIPVILKGMDHIYSSLYDLFN